MASSFSIMRSHFTATPASTLCEEIREHTGSEEEAASILRGIIRLGADASIRRYEMTPSAAQRSYAGAPAVSWSVRAVRP
jgi:hypothetical protein